MFNQEVTEKLIHWFVSSQKGHKMDKLALLKLVFFADRYHLRNFSRTITGDVYFAKQHGPVANNTYDLLTQICGGKGSRWAKAHIIMPNTDKILAKGKGNISDFSESEMEAIKFVERNFGGFSMKKLEDLTHQYPEWKKFETLIDSKETKSVEMNLADMLSDSEESKEYYPELPKSERDAKEEWIECGLI